MDSIQSINDYVILPDLKLIIEYFSGRITAEGAIDLKMKEKEDENYSPTFNVLVDFRDLVINWTAQSDERLNRFISFMKSNPDMISVRKSALITSDPFQMVLSTYLKKQYFGMKIKPDIFSTVDAAMYYLGVPQDSLSVINEEIGRMRGK